jgi:leucyl-tRNA synthetase
MIATNELTTLACHKREVLEPLVIAIAPFAPFIAEELWSALGNTGSVHQAAFPKVEEKYLVESSHKYAVSINGKVRAEVELPLDITAQEVEKQVLELEAVKKWTNGNPPKKFIYVKGKIVNVVV